MLRGLCRCGFELMPLKHFFSIFFVPSVPNFLGIYTPYVISEISYLRTVFMTQIFPLVLNFNGTYCYYQAISYLIIYFVSSGKCNVS